MKVLVVLGLFVLLAAAPAAQTTYTWTGGSGSWFTESNWSPSGVPGDGDTALVTSGSPELTRDTTVASVELSGEALTGDGHLTVTEAFEWTAGNLDGTFSETAALTIAEGATLHVHGDAEKGLRGRDVFNEGTILWEGTGNIDLKASTVLENRAGALFDIRNDASLTRSNGTLAFLNHGLLVKSAGTGQTTLAYGFGALENHGTLRVENGTLRVALAGSSLSTDGDGAFEVEGGATLSFNNGRYTFGDGSTLSGAGTLTSTGELAFGSSDLTGSLLVGGGQLSLGSGDLTGTTVVLDGGLLFTDPDTPSALGAVTLSGGSLGSEGEADVHGLITWTGGRLGFGGGVLDLLGGVSAEGEAVKLLGGGTFNNAAAFTWTGTGDIEIRGGSTFNNLEGALFDIQNDATVFRTNGFVDFLNEGLIMKSAGAGTTLLNLPFRPFNNAGEVRVETGTLHVNVSNSGSNSTDTGAWVVEDGTTLRFSNHQRIFEETASIEGTGTLVVDANMDFRMGGVVRPGLSPGLLLVDGDYPEPEPEGALEIELGGTEPGTEHDVLDVTNIADLGGTLRLVLADGFEPTGDETFTVVTALAVQGTFAEVESPAGYVAETTYGAQDVAVRVVPVGGCADGLQPDEHTTALYKFDEPLPGTSFDASGNGLDATDDGTEVTEGRFCSARRFDGESDRIDMDVVREAMQGQTEWTIEYVARSENGSSVPELVNHRCGNGWWLGPRSSTIRFGIKTTAAGGNCLWTVGEAFAEAEMDTDWHYYALTWDADSLRVYRDGAFLDSRPAGGAFLENQSSNNRAWIGHSDSGSGSYTAGLADDLRVSDVARSGEELCAMADALGFGCSTTDTEDDALPLASVLHAPYPNPTNRSATLGFDLAEAGPVRLAVYDVLGREVAVLVDEDRPAGRYEAVLDGRSLAAGVYLARLTAEGLVQTQRFTLLR